MSSNKKIATEIDENTLVTGAEFRDFYKNHWPKGYYVEEMPYDVEDEQGKWVLPDDAERELKSFGFAVDEKDGTFVPMHEFYAKHMGRHNDEVIITFKVASKNLQKLEDAASSIGARKI